MFVTYLSDCFVKLFLLINGLALHLIASVLVQIYLQKFNRPLIVFQLMKNKYIHITMVLKYQKVQKVRSYFLSLQTLGETI